MADASIRPVCDPKGNIVSWSVRWRERDGRRLRRIFADKALAERLVAEKRSAQAGKKRRPRGAKRAQDGCLHPHGERRERGGSGQMRTSTPRSQHPMCARSR